MTSYAVLADQMLAAGLKGSSPAKARDLANRSMYGEPMSEIEAQIVAKWLAMPWSPERSRQKPTEGETLL